MSFQKKEKISWGHVVLCFRPFAETSMSCRSLVGSVGFSDFTEDISVQSETQVEFLGEEQLEWDHQVREMGVIHL